MTAIVAAALVLGVEFVRWWMARKSVEREEALALSIRERKDAEKAVARFNARVDNAVRTTGTVESLLFRLGKEEKGQRVLEERAQREVKSFFGEDARCALDP